MLKQQQPIQTESITMALYEIVAVNVITNCYAEDVEMRNKRNPKSQHTKIAKLFIAVFGIWARTAYWPLLLRS